MHIIATAGNAIRKMITTCLLSSTLMRCIRSQVYSNTIVLFRLSNYGTTLKKLHNGHNTKCCSRKEFILIVREMRYCFSEGERGQVKKNREVVSTNEILLHGTLWF